MVIERIGERKKLCIQSSGEYMVHGHLTRTFGHNIISCVGVFIHETVNSNITQCIHINCRKYYIRNSSFETMTILTVSVCNLNIKLN